MDSLCSKMHTDTRLQACGDGCRSGMAVRYTITNIAARAFCRHRNIVNKHLNQCNTDSDDNMPLFMLPASCRKPPASLLPQGTAGRGTIHFQTISITFTLGTAQLRLYVKTHNTSPPPTHLSPTGRSQDVPRTDSTNNVHSKGTQITTYEATHCTMLHSMRCTVHKHSTMSCKQICVCCL
jgi:hypothetical protein